MHISTLAVALFAAFVAATPQGTSSTTTIKPGAVTSHIAPPNQTAPPGCSPNYSGTFEIGPVNMSSSSKRDLSERNTMLGITLVNGVLTDPYGRTGYIASNSQFQFDGPPQSGAIYTAGFSVCENGSLALGSDITWWSCLSGTFFNLYLDSVGGQCVESYIVTYPVGDGHPLPVSAAAAAGSGTLTSSGTLSAPAYPSASSLRNATMTSSSNRTAIITRPTLKTTKASRSTTLTSETDAVGPTSASAASSPLSSSQGAAAHATGLGRAMLGLAGGLFAFALV